jgi:hypothetical protein
VDSEERKSKTMASSNPAVSVSVKKNLVDFRIAGEFKIL